MKKLKAIEKDQFKAGGTHNFDNLTSGKLFSSWGLITFDELFGCIFSSFGWFCRYILLRS